MQDFKKAIEYLRHHNIEKPEIGIVLGTGLHHFLDYRDIEQTVPYQQIPGFALSTVEFHKGTLVSGKIGNGILSYYLLKVLHDLDEEKDLQYLNTNN